MDLGFDKQTQKKRISPSECIDMSYWLGPDREGVLMCSLLSDRLINAAVFQWEHREHQSAFRQSQCGPSVQWETREAPPEKKR